MKAKSKKKESAAVSNDNTDRSLVQDKDIATIDSNNQQLHYLSLTNSDKKTLVDRDIYLKYKDKKVYLNNGGYVLVGRNESLHRLIMGLTKDSYMLVDHVNGNTLDNRRENLRLAYSLQNTVNCKRPKNVVSDYRGVFPTKNGKYSVCIRYNDRDYYLGRFDSEFKGALAYDKAQLYLHGEFARLNFPDQVHLHKKLRVRYIDYDKIPLITEQELEDRAKSLLEKRKKFAENSFQQRKDSYKSYVKKVTNRYLGKVLKISLHGKKGEGKFFYTDREYYDTLIEYRFYIHPDGIVWGKSLEDKFQSIFDILNIPKYLSYEFIDNNTYNYTRNNITGKEIENINIRRVRKKEGATSKYLGVHKTESGTFKASINLNGTTTQLGCSTSEEFCAKLYDVAMKRKFGKDAILNFPNYENPNIKLPWDKGYHKLPLLRLGVNGYFGVKRWGKQFRAMLIGIKLGIYPTEQLAALAVAYASVVTGLYKVDLRFLNFSKEEYKRLTADYSLLTKEERLKIRKLLKGIKWM